MVCVSQIVRADMEALHRADLVELLAGSVKVPRELFSGVSASYGL
jgi:hypothetical protein